MPITIKDNFKTKGIKTTSGYLPLKNNIPTEDAEIVKLLLAEDAITENPVLSMPISLGSDSLPIGIQVIGKRCSDFRLLKVGKVLRNYAEKIKYKQMKV